MPSLKPLKSVAHNLCHQFASTFNYWGGDYGINHLARSVRAENQVKIDLLAGASEPALLGEGAHAIDKLAGLLPELLAKEGFDTDLLVGATAIYRFHDPLPVPGGSVAYDCRVEFKTAGGRSYCVELSQLNTP
ncbi:hypothetical protein [Lysobacter sp. Root916]|uniref:hypothetical protein n=1 Tax=Lysobacter sp. Root916 TaxID=1736606 RepID=UPI0012FCF593|nr:hypothetical protein [Lysobacter sp. Root916]